MTDDEPKAVPKDDDEPHLLTEAAIETGGAMTRMGKELYDSLRNMPEDDVGDPEMLAKNLDLAANLFGTGVRSVVSGLVWEILTKGLGETMDGVDEWAKRMVRAQELQALVTAASTLEDRLDWNERDALLGRIEALAEKLGEGEL